MKRAFIASLVIVVTGLAANALAGGHACPDGNCPDCKPGIFQRASGWWHSKHCSDCGKTCGPFHKCCGLFHRRGRGNEMVDYGGPPAAQITYPYYTNRGPRDFLDPNPRGIGP
ncbi:MAG TPA: hypothetical protein VHC22_25295 [Pirellulales bacterium]|nr:hypothetical protein [Pirellulales bacterium]